MSIILDKILTKLDTDIVSHSKIIKDETDANGLATNSGLYMIGRRSGLEELKYAIVKWQDEERLAKCK